MQIFFTLLLTIIFSLFSTAVMSYISMATVIGPWIGPSIVLLASLICRWFIAPQARSEAVCTITAGASIGGILATACGFSFPTLYFLDRSLFMQWISQPYYFVLIMIMLCAAAGLFAFWLADILEDQMLVEQQLPFPVSQLMYKLVAAQYQLRKAFELMVGFISSMIWSLAQMSWFGFRALPSSLTIINERCLGIFSVPMITLRLDYLPMLLAIGFIAGSMIAIPLTIGMLSKYVILDPLNVLLFKQISSNDFLLAFCSGMVVIGVIVSFMDAPQTIVHAIKKLRNFKQGHLPFYKKNSWPLIIIMIIALLFFWIFFKFNIIVLLYLLIGSFLCTYQIIGIAGKIGLAQLGRFATFVMVPAIFLFNLTVTQIVMIATFVELCGGIATDLMFGRKMAYLAQMTSRNIRLFQMLGLVVSTISVGIFFWFLINHFGLGSEELFAQRAQSRALLINIYSFNFIVLLLGALFGLLLKYIKLNPMLVLGGLLMPVNYSLGLIIGGLLTYFVKDRHEWDPFWSGVFAGNSIWELLRAIV